MVCNFISSSSASAFWHLDMCSCSFGSPIAIYAVIIHECLVGHAFRAGWNNTDFYWGLSCFALLIMPIRIKLRESSVVSEDFWELSCKVMVGRLVGWFMNFPALKNWLSMFHSLTVGSCTTYFTLQDQVFPECLSCSIWTILYLDLHFKSHLPGCLFFK